MDELREGYDDQDKFEEKTNQKHQGQLLILMLSQDIAKAKL